jgi:hypothetical protein
MSDFAVNKKKTQKEFMENDFFYGNHEFNIEKPESFIRKKSSTRDSIYSKSDQYWSKTVTKV